MSLRSELRRQQRDKAKTAKRMAKALPWMPAEQVTHKVNFTYDRLQDMYKEDIEHIKKGMSDICAEELLKGEQYMMVGLTMVALKSLEMTFGDLKTVQKGMGRFLRNFNQAIEYVDSTGIMETYRELQVKYGLGDLGFEDYAYDINNIQSIWDNKEQKVSDLLLEVWNKRKVEIDKLGEEVEAVV